MARYTLWWVYETLYVSGTCMSPARYQDNRISWQDTLCDECMRLCMSLGLITVKPEILVVVIFGGFENITICKDLMWDIIERNWLGFHIFFQLWLLILRNVLIRQFHQIKSSNNLSFSSLSPARYQDNRISWQDTLCDECMRLFMSQAR